jgi:hypothetical protein
MRLRRRSKGFTLIELIIAASLSTIVLIGVFSLMSSLVQTEVAGMRNGTVTAWTLANINTMNMDIAGASYIAVPAAGGNGDSLVVCTNWSATALGPATPGVVNKLANAPILGTPAVNAVYYYCYDTADSAPFKNAILRKILVNPAGGAGACPNVAPACLSGNYPGDSIVATGIYRDAANDKIFTADPPTLNAHTNAVHLHFVVGNPNPGTSAGGGQEATNVPQSIPFDTRIILED